MRERLSDLMGLRLPDGKAAAYSMEEIDKLLQRSVQNFRTQKELPDNIPKKIEEKSLQIYFW